MAILNVGYDSTNYYLIGPEKSRLMVDTGWPGTLPKFRALLKRMDIAFESIRHLLVTHYHPDHAGLVQELKNEGVRLIVLEHQLQAIPMLKPLIKPEYRYVDIKTGDVITLTSSTSRAFLQTIGIAGSIIETTGHSDDSITLVLDDGAAFTGDLPYPGVVDHSTASYVIASWNAIRAAGGRMIYPGHGPARPLSE